MEEKSRNGGGGRIIKEHKMTIVEKKTRDRQRAGKKGQRRTQDGKNCNERKEIKQGRRRKNKTTETEGRREAES